MYNATNYFSNVNSCELGKVNWEETIRHLIMRPLTFRLSIKISSNRLNISQIFNIHIHYNFLTNKLQNYFVLPNIAFNFVYANRDGY